jgi:CheY-like chemotaxis protein
MPVSHNRSSTDPGRKLGKTVAPHLFGLPKAEFDALLDELVQPSNKSPALPERVPHLGFRVDDLAIDIWQPGGGERSTKMVAYQLSCLHIAALNTFYLHVGSTCRVHLPRRAGGVVRINGVVAACSHISRQIHQVIIRFREPIDLREIVEIDVLSQTNGLKPVAPESLVGRVVLATDCRFQAANIRDIFSKTQVRLDVVNDPTKVLDACRTDCGALLCDEQLETADGKSLLSVARDIGISVPLIAMSADSSSEARLRIRAAQPDGFVSLPATSESLIGAVSEFLTAKPGGVSSAGNCSSLDENSPLFEQSEQYAEALQAWGADLQKAFQANDLNGARAVAIRIIATAPNLGFGQIAELATTFVKSVAGSMSLAESSRDLSALANACRAARRRKAPADAQSPSEQSKPAAAA